ncbi:hypothetical protein KAX97_03900 [candidate division WOR-3 bacterium]|nr:hypothetical protein [candidate division WOR-3 bacterium]
MSKTIKGDALTDFKECTQIHGFLSVYPVREYFYSLQDTTIETEVSNRVYICDYPFESTNNRTR